MVRVTVPFPHRPTVPFPTEKAIAARAVNFASRVI